MNGYWLGVATPFTIVLGILLLWLAGTPHAENRKKLVTKHETPT